MRRGSQGRVGGRLALRSAGRPRNRAAQCSGKAGPETGRGGPCSQRYWHSPGCARCYLRSSAAQSFHWRRYKVLESFFLLQILATSSVARLFISAARETAFCNISNWRITLTRRTAASAGPVFEDSSWPCSIVVDDGAEDF